MLATPRYLPHSNYLSPDAAQVIAKRFGDDIEFLKPELDQANGYAMTPLTRADLNGQGLGQYHNAESLFLGYVYEMHRCAACESAESIRREEFD